MHANELHRTSNLVISRRYFVGDIKQISQNLKKKLWLPYSRCRHHCASSGEFRQHCWMRTIYLIIVNCLFVCLFFCLEEFSGRCCCENSVSRTRCERNRSTKRSRPCYDTGHEDHSRCLNHSQASKQNKQTNKQTEKTWQIILPLNGDKMLFTVMGQTSNP